MYVSLPKPAVSVMGLRRFGVTNPFGAAQLAGVPEDGLALLSIGFTPAQVSQIFTAHASGALSDGGYQALVTGNVDPANLADLLAADPGYTGPAGPDWGTWIQQNAKWVGLGLIGFALLNSFMPRGRR